jgi:putative peptide zinc metalloprotease protein
MAIIAEVPARPDGLELIGEMAGSGYRTPQSLVRRQDGQTLQLTPLLYAVLEAIDGQRDYADIARVVSARTGRSVAATDVEQLVDGRLRPIGLVLSLDGSAPRLKRSNPLTGLRLKLAVTDPALTRRLTQPFTILFHWWIWLPLLAVFGWVAWWLLMDRGLASATYQAFAKPNLMVLVILITVLSAGLHEFGHAAAARRGGAQPGVMGAGWYLLWPAFYTDVTDTYRLGRSARIRTDLGGLYFNAIVAVAITATWWLTGWDALLLVVAAQVIQMIRQLTPLVRFDGYHVLADLTGVPDLFSRIGPILASFWPPRWRDPRVAELKWWTRFVVTLWVLVVVPALLLCLVALVLAAPRLIGTALESLGREWEQLTLHWNAAQHVDAAGAVLAMVAVSLPIVAMAVIASRMATRVVSGLWRGTEGRPVRRAGAGVLVAAMGVALAMAWWPDADRYRPVLPYEGGTLFDVAGATLAATGYQSSAAPSEDGGEIVTVLPRSAPLPTEAEPELAVVLVPSGSLQQPEGDAQPAAGAIDAPVPAWVFPFNEPLPPEPGDNQALAVNTTDNSVTYDVAIAMVWVTGEDPVLNVNEAYAFASCSDCVTVAVAFQVVVIVGSADVVVPQNLSGALNYECFRCITASIASQLVVTVDSLPGVEEQVALADLWEEITAFAESIPTLPLADVIARLEAYKAEVISILGVAPAAAPSPTPVPAAAPTMAATASPSVLPTAGASSGSPEATPPATPMSDPSEASSPDATPVDTGSTSQPTASPSPSPTPTASPTPSASSPSGSP